MTKNKKHNMNQHNNNTCKMTTPMTTKLPYKNQIQHSKTAIDIIKALYNYK